MLDFNASDSSNQTGDDSASVGEVTQISNSKSSSTPAYVDDTGYIGGAGVEMSYGSSADSAQMDWLQTDMESHWVSMFLMLAGWMIIIRAVAHYASAKRTEKIISALPVEERPENVDRD